MEKCPKCNSVYIQQDRITKKCYCLEKICGHKWTMKLPQDISKIENPYLRTSMR